MTRRIILAAALPLAFTQPVLAQAAKPISRSDFIKNIDAKFAAMDTNHDGKLTLDEFAAEQQRELQQAKALVIQRLTAQFHQLDTNKDGQLSLQEFLAAAPNVRANQTPQDLMRKFDTKHDGKVTLEEFRAPDLARFNQLDTNHDGVISPEELQAGQGKK